MTWWVVSMSVISRPSASPVAQGAFFGLNRRRSHSFTIEAANPLERATELVLKPVNELLDFKPGQFAFVQVQGKGW